MEMKVVCLVGPFVPNQNRSDLVMHYVALSHIICHVRPEMYSSPRDVSQENRQQGDSREGGGREDLICRIQSCTGLPLHSTA